jgi:hypothetical protein
MPAKPRFPRLVVDITPGRWDTAVAASSGGCLIADAIEDAYPRFSGVLVDAQTVRVSDKTTGERYTYLTPRSAQDLLLSFDQGWAEPEDHTVRLRTPIKVEKITRSRVRTTERAERKAVLTAKRDAGVQLSGRDRQSLTKLERTDEQRPEVLPHTRGPISEVISLPGDEAGISTIVGGPPLPRPKGNPNLLGGRNRLFGAKTARPAEVFQRAVDQAVADRLAAGGREAGATQNPGPPAGIS